MSGSPHDRAIPAPPVRRRIPRVPEALAAVVVPFVVSRFVVAVAMVVGGSETLRRPTLGTLVYWDGQWFQAIVESGYGPAPAPGQQTPWPFFPLYPLLARVVTWVGVPPKAALVLVSHAAFVVALAGVWRLAHDRFGPATARWAVWFVVLFPFTVVFSMAYASSLFLAGTVWGFVFAERRRDLAAGCAIAVAALVRPNGFLAVAVLAVAVGASAWRTAGIGAAVRRAVPVAAPGAIGVVAFCAWCWDRTGDPLVFWDAKRAWDEITLVEYLRDVPQGAEPHVAAFGVAVLVVAVATVARRLPAPWLALAALTTLPSLAIGLIGLGRYAIECFTVGIAGGFVLAGLPRRVAVALLVASVAGMFAFAWLVRRDFLP